MPLVIPGNKEGDKSTISTEGEPPQTGGIRVSRDLQEFGVPSHVGGLGFQPTCICDGEETQRVFRDKFTILEGLFVNIKNNLYVVHSRCEEKGLQVVKIVDDRMWHGVDGSKDVFPCFRGFLDIDMW